MYRWWDGSAWTPTVTPNPYAPPPQAGPAPQYSVSSAQQVPSGAQQNTTGYPGANGPADPYAQAAARKSSWGALAVIAVVVIALIAGAFALLGSDLNPFSGEPAASNPTTDVCPKVTAETVSPTPHTAAAGRVQGGRLSYPQLSAPWGAIEQEVRVPFGRDVVGQSVLVEGNYDGEGSNWVASIVVGELVAGDGFFSPEEGSAIVTRCIMGVFYGDAVLDRTDVLNQATTIDGYDAWLVEMHLGFRIQGLRETGETAIIVIVSTSQESSSIFYASVPDSTPQLLVDARQAQADLRVES